MRFKLTIAPLALLAALMSACATTAAEGPPPQESWVMYGQVESIRVLDHYVQGNPGGGAAAGR